ncbi:TM1802 family CRISPR-associated protein [Desulforamulus ruminis]|uniref:CRISPR-associated protein TM1802 n=1 Tax=Desulforamulus ruminis (strain ATCC 23193 / DSM 2154 / NCIMB 8452 / DL) TaxID=696281 RepID=F6DTN9_DESRL|nr:TM1802 family CRISPR-associated protein [Desulforamulus ruminis]AEG61213.1 CRISPR-associated protein TM1802 [Desulforamulus ruminis DSM 2154]
MLVGMRTLGLDYLVQELCNTNIPVDPENWYLSLRNNEPHKLFSLLVEDSGRIEKVYVIEKDAEDVVSVSVQDVTVSNSASGCTADKLPFIKPSGSQSAQVGPVIKRSYSKDKGAGPSEKILETTINYFKEIADSKKPWSRYFQDIIMLLEYKEIKFLDGTKVDWAENKYKNLLACVVDKIGPQSGTVFLTIKTPDGKYPGEQLVYIKYLLKEKLAGERYVTSSSPAKENQMCYLCNTSNVLVFPNGLKGAGINIKNPDRAGAFPGIDVKQAWKGYSLCGACADLLYIYKNHVLKKRGPQKDKIPYTAKIAGENALVVPIFLPGTLPETRIEVLEQVTRYIQSMGDNVTFDEDWLLDMLKEEKSILNLSILWVDIGQNIENVVGTIEHVLPSRLRELSEINTESLFWKHALFPAIQLDNSKINLTPKLSLQALKPLFKRPGGKRAKSVNASQRLFQLKRLLAENVYHGNLMEKDRFWGEFLLTARWYWLEAIEKTDGQYGLLYEGLGKKGPYLTAAGWIKYVNWWLYYFKKVGIFRMETSYFEPTMLELRPYFGPESGIDSPDKAYAFLLGVLYGKVLQVQGAKGVNVGANALTWLKRLTLKGRDLPELYNKIRDKSFAYDIEGNEKVRKLVAEIGRLGINLGDNICLDEVQTSYYLLLGQSMTETIIPSIKNK